MPNALNETDVRAKPNRLALTDVKAAKIVFSAGKGQLFAETHDFLQKNTFFLRKNAIFSQKIFAKHFPGAKTRFSTFRDHKNIV